MHVLEFARERVHSKGKATGAEGIPPVFVLSFSVGRLRPNFFGIYLKIEILALELKFYNFSVPLSVHNKSHVLNFRFYNPPF